MRCSRTGPSQSYAGADRRVPAAGSEIARVTEQARRLVAAPDLRGLTVRQRLNIANWSSARVFGGKPPDVPAFTVFEKTVSELADAMQSGRGDE